MYGFASPLAYYMHNIRCMHSSHRQHTSKFNDFTVLCDAMRGFCRTSDSDHTSLGNNEASKPLLLGCKHAAGTSWLKHQPWLERLQRAARRNTLLQMS